MMSTIEEKHERLQDELGLNVVTLMSDEEECPCLINKKQPHGERAGVEFYASSMKRHDGVAFYGACVSMTSARS